MARIVISYRRDDASAHAGRIYDRLRTEFGSDQVFMDIDAIEPGVDFVEAIEDAIGTADVLIAVIGRRWVTIADEDGQPRIKNPADFVRLELATALQRNIRVIPVLVDTATMPTIDDLPEDLAGLVRRNAIDISHARFHADAQRLAMSVRRILDQPEEERSAMLEEDLPAPTPDVARSTADRPSWKRRILIGGVTLLAIIAIVAAYVAYGFLTLPPEPSTFSRLAWSPDGQRIAFSATTPMGKTHLYSLATDGSGWEKLESDASTPVTWSPDGEWITFARALHYLAMSPGGDESRVLPGDAIFDGSLAWSPDSRKAAYWTRDIGDDIYHLRVLDFADNGLQTVTRTRALGSGRDHGIAWSPDASLIAVVVRGDGQDELGVVHAVTGEARGVFRGGQIAIEYPCWSMDGEWIVFSATSARIESAEQAIFRIRPGGTDLERLTDESLNATGSRISPDGLVVAATMASSAWGSRQLFVMNLDGSGQPRPISPDTLSIYPESLSWSPDGSRLAFVTLIDTGRLFGRFRSTVAVANRDGRDFQILLR